MPGHIEIFESAVAEERLQQALRFVENFPRATEILLVGATREAIDDFARRLAVPGLASFGLHRFSFLQLAAYIARGVLAAQGLAPASALAAEALAARASFEARRDGFEYFGPVAHLRGFALALAKTVSDLRASTIDINQLATLSASGRDLCKLVTRYEEQLGHGRLADRAALFRTATDCVQGEPPFFAGWPVLLLDVPIAGAIEGAFVRSLHGAAGQAFATVPEGDAKTADAFAGMSALRVGKGAGDRGDSPLRRVQSNVFSLSAPSAAPARAGDHQDAVVFFSAPGEGRECVEIARRIMQEARRGVPFDGMAVVLRSPELYSGLLEAAFRRAGIPGYFARGAKAPDPSGRAFLALLACVLERFSARRFAEYLSLGQVPVLDESGRPPAEREVWVASEDEALQHSDAVPVESPETAQAPEPGSAVDGAELEGSLRVPWHWEGLLVEAAVIGGRDRWQRRLDGLRAEWQIRLIELQGEEPESARTRAVQRDLDNLKHLRAFCLPLIEYLGSFPDAASWGDWLSCLERLAPMVLRHSQRVLSVLAELRPMAEVGPVTLLEVRDVLADRLTTVESAPSEDRFGSVFVGTPDHVRGRSFEAVFVPGLAERVFPEKLREDPLLLDHMRVQLGAELATRSGRAEQERLRLRLAAGAASKRLYLSYSRMELAESRPRVPSFYALDVERARTGRIPDGRELERSAARAGGSGLAWPAPADPAQGIDDLEHDLAVLGPLLRHPNPAAVRGRARYLLELNPELARSLRMRYARWERAWSAYDGLCAPASAGVVSALEPYRLPARPYSASSLQQFAACPYRFLLSAIYRLEPREDPAPLEKMDPLTRGSLFHRVQAELSRQLLDQHKFPVVPENLESALQELDVVLNRVAEEYRDLLAPAIDRIWQDEIERLRSDLHSWIGRLAESSRDWEPIHFEFGFGLHSDSSMDPASTPDAVTLQNGCKLHGAVDLIERRTDRPELRVTDHKTGKNYTQPGMVVGGGEILQPVLYAFAVESALGLRVSESRLYYCTADGAFAERPVRVDENARKMGLEVLEIIDDAVRSGFLPPAPRTNACAWCDFRAVCGPNEELRLSYKDPTPLREVTRLRGLP